MRLTLQENDYTNEDIDTIVKTWNAESAEVFFNDGTEPLKARSWTYSNAFFFAFHLCTTIGYGDISPITVYGQIIAVLYATIGIPLTILFFKLLGESFAQNYQETIWRIKGDEDSTKKKMLADLGFFLPWTLVLFLIPSIVFMFTEDWDIIEGIYYSFITLTTIGLGDYVAGGGLLNSTYYILYKMVIFCWMIYGLAFTSMIVDYLAHLYQMYLFFEFNCDRKQCDMSFKRTYVDIEKLDVHFRLLRSEGVKHKHSIWAVRTTTILSVDYHTRHLSNLACLAEKMQGEIVTLLQEYALGGEDLFEMCEDEFLDKVPKDAFPVKVPEDDVHAKSTEPILPAKNPKDAFHVKTRNEEDNRQE